MACGFFRVILVLDEVPQLPSQQASTMPALPQRFNSNDSRELQGKRKRLEMRKARGNAEFFREKRAVLVSLEMACIIPPAC